MVVKAIILGSVTIGMLIGGPGCKRADLGEELDGGRPSMDGGPPHTDGGPPHMDGSPGVQESVTLLPGESVAYEHLGFSVAASGNSVAVGAKDSNRSGLAQSGAVIVFERDEGGSWSQSNVFTSPDAAAGDSFGFSIALSSNVLVVGAPLGAVFGIQTGAVYVFNKTVDGRWVESARFGSPDGGAFDIFGFSVAIDGDRIVVGAIQAGDERQGAALVYERDGVTWRLEATLLPSDGMSGAKFGSAVASFGSKVLVGAMSDSHLVPAAGSAYVFEKDAQGWSEKIKLLPDDSARSDFWGYSVALSQDTAVVGSYLKKDMSRAAVGAAYVFRNVGLKWVQQEKIVPSDAAPGDAFGMSISLRGNVMAIGSPRNDDAAPNGGAVYVFQQDEFRWKQLAKLYRAAAHENDEYGQAVMLSDSGFVAAGAWLAGSSKPEAGAAEIAALPCPQPCPLR